MAKKAPTKKTRKRKYARPSFKKHGVLSLTSVDAYY